MYESERVTKAKLQEDMHKLRQYYDKKISSVDGKYANLPPPGASECSFKSQSKIIKRHSKSLNSEIPVTNSKLPSFEWS